MINVKWDEQIRKFSNLEVTTVFGGRKKLDSKRKLSIYDYTVKTSSGLYNCVSISEGNKIFMPYDPMDKNAKREFSGKGLK